jgi:hypothetical protein
LGPAPALLLGLLSWLTSGEEVSRSQEKKGALHMDEADKGQQAEEQQDAVTAAVPLTRKRVAERLGVSIFKVRSLEGKTLHPHCVNGVHHFDTEEVDKLARTMEPSPRPATKARTEGETAALAFRAFDADKDLHAVVQELEVPPEQVRALYREWREPDLEEFEINKRKRERVEAQQREDEEEQRRHDRSLENFERTMAKFSK